ncbi:hypothetical protein CRUP_033853, partial [Coryphaenoides rupestris]
MLQLYLLLLHLLLLCPDASTYMEHSGYFGAGASLPAGHGPVFEEQPVDTIYPEESPEARITLNCRARASPPASYRWMLQGEDIDVEEDNHYSVVGGNLVITNPSRDKHLGNYSCNATNDFGTIVSQQASVQFGSELLFRWMLNEFPIFIPLDKRRFVSQTTGNLYISKVDRSDTGNYSCFVSSHAISKSVFSKFIPLVPLAERPIRKYPADIKVQFPDTPALLGQNITLECFALGNPIPEISWMKQNGELPPNHEVSMAGAHLHLHNVQYEDAGSYTCEARNSKGKDYHTVRISVEDVNSDYTMTCEASGKPRPHVHWLRNGHRDSGMYQCIAENRHGVLRAAAELRVIDGAGGQEQRALIECRPKAAPRPALSWSKGTELLSNSTPRVLIWEDGTLEILNVTRADEGRYTCFAENNRGKDNSTGSLTVTDQTKITLAPSNGDVTVGESARMQCGASHDPSLEIAIVWSLNGRVIDPATEDGRHFQRTSNGSSNGELLIKDTQLKHAGKYSCMAETIVDNAVGLKEKSVALQWSRGLDNHSPISKYTVQYRDPFSPEWRDAPTDPVNVEGNAEAATVVDLFPWIQYDFRVTATNTLGTGESSAPLLNITTLEAAPVPVKPQYYFGKNFGYIIAFKPHDGVEWRKVTVADPQAQRYTHKDPSIPPSTQFHVK